MLPDSNQELKTPVVPRRAVTVPKPVPHAQETADTYGARDVVARQDGRGSAARERSQRMRFALRIAIPDQPGALNAVTAALGSCGADIVALAVVERGQGIAVDDVCVMADVGPKPLRRALEEIPGVVVEAVRGVVAFRDATAPIDLAAGLVSCGPERLAVLVAGLPAALWATWCVALRHRGGRLEVLSAAGGVPDLGGIAVPWVPLEMARPLELSGWLPADVEHGARRAGVTLAAAPVGDPQTVVLVGRVGGPRFLPAEVRQLGQLARIAAAGDALGPELATGRAGRAATAGRS
jgi:hypothetical protein